MELPADDWAVIGTFLRTMRSRRNWTQEEAARRGKPGLSRAPLSLLEQGKPENNRPLRSTLEGVQRAYELPDEWWMLVLSGELVPPRPGTHVASGDLDEDLQRKLDAIFDEQARRDAERS